MRCVSSSWTGLPAVPVNKPIQKRSRVNGSAFSPFLPDDHKNQEDLPRFSQKDTNDASISLITGGSINRYAESKGRMVYDRCTQHCGLSLRGSFTLIPRTLLLVSIKAADLLSCLPVPFPRPHCIPAKEHKQVLFDLWRVFKRNKLRLRLR